ncbi:MAG: hypothetical protein U0X39_12205 [Bacteroidales bacterium]
MVIIPGYVLWSAYLKVIGDFARWNDCLVTDDYATHSVFEQEKNKSDH